jgi:hypothetical protein
MTVRFGRERGSTLRVFVVANQLRRVKVLERAKPTREVASIRIQRFVGNFVDLFRRVWCSPNAKATDRGQQPADACA